MGVGFNPLSFWPNSKPYLNQGGRLCPPNNTGTLEFTDLPTALVMASQESHAYLLVCELCNNCELVIEILKYVAKHWILDFRR